MWNFCLNLLRKRRGKKWLTKWLSLRTQKNVNHMRISLMVNWNIYVCVLDNGEKCGVVSLAYMYGYIWAPQLVYLKIKPIHFPFLMLSLLSSFFINTTHPPKIGSHKTSNRKTLSGLNHIVLASVVLKASKFLLQDEGRMHFSSIAFSCARKLRVSCRSLRYVLGLTSNLIMNTQKSAFDSFLLKLLAGISN